MSIQTINLQSQPMPIDGDRDSCSAHQPARSYLATKRALDIIVSLMALAVIAPAVIRGRPDPRLPGARGRSIESSWSVASCGAS